MIPADPLASLAPLVISLLPWAADKIAGHLLEKGSDSSADLLKRWASDREVQRQLHQAIDHAIRTTQLDPRYSMFEQLFDGEELARNVVRVAAIPMLLADPDYDSILHESVRLTADHQIARDALEFFFTAFRSVWERQPAFETLRPAYNATLTRREVQEISRATELAIKELRAIRQQLEKGVPTFPKGIRQPDSVLAQAYLEEVAKQKPYINWNDQAYVDRTVTGKTDEWFMRTVARYERQSLDPSEQIKAEPLEEALARVRKLVLLGAPGLGKTTSLLHLTWSAAHRSSIGITDGEIPIFIELKHYRGEAEIETLLARRVNEILAARNLILSPELEASKQVIKAWLANPAATFLLLLDGLNEVRPEYHDNARSALLALLNYPHRIVISCREHDYDESLHFRTSAFVLQGLEKSEIRRYLQGALQESPDLLFQRFKWDAKMQTLASNPLMLWLISVVAKGDLQSQFPSNRGKLFQRFVEIMPRLRAREGNYPRIPLDVVTATLSKLGFEMQCRGRLAVELGEVRSWEIPNSDKPLEDILWQAKDWRFLKSDGRLGEQVEFIHQLFLEYFAAVYLKTQLHVEKNVSNLQQDRYFTGEWDEVITMLAGIADNPAVLVQRLAEWVVARRQGRYALLVRRCWKMSDASQDIQARSAVVDSLLLALDDRLARSNAISMLGQIGDDRAVNPLIAALSDANVGVRKGAAKALGRLRASRAVDPLVAALRDPSGGVRADAAFSLGQIGDPRAIEPLVATLRSKNPDLRKAVIGALKQIGVFSAEALAPLLLDRDRDVRMMGARYLGQSKDPCAVELLIPLLTDPSSAVRKSAAHALGEIRDPQAIAPLIDALLHSTAGVRKRAAIALMRIGAPSVEPLISILCDTNKAARRRVVGVLGQIADPRAVQPLIDALRDPDVNIHWWAAIALGRIGDPRALPELEQMAQEDSGVTWEGKSVSDAAREAVKKIRQRMEPDFDRD